MGFLVSDNTPVYVAQESANDQCNGNNPHTQILSSFLLSRDKVAKTAGMNPPPGKFAMFKTPLVRFAVVAMAAFSTIAGIDAAAAVHVFRPSETTSGINPSFDNFHEAYRDPSVTPRNKLLVFLPGTGVGPNVYRFFPETAAQLGFHVINLMYVNSFEFIGMAVTNNCDTCYEETRWEILTGDDTSPFENVDRENSIEHRLIKAIEHLHGQHPTEDWIRYLNGSNLTWNSIIIAGHSQGAGQAGFIAKQFLVDRAIMFDSGDWYDLESRPATWISTPGATPANRFYGAAHTNDPLFPNPHQIPAWTAFGLAQVGPVVFVENTSDAQFDCSHMLRTAVEPRNNTGETAYHGAMVRDEHVPLDAFNEPVFKPLWVHLLSGKTECSTTFDGDGKHDLATYHPPSGTWQLFQSTDGFADIQFGSRNMMPLEGDFDGDRRLDLAVFEPTSGTWYINGSQTGLRVESLGDCFSIPVPADYDGDGIHDLAVFDTRSGTWFIRFSGGGSRIEQFGNRRTFPGPGDFDGDGKDDLAIYDPSSSTWMLQQSRDGFAMVQVGKRGGWPAHGDYDGDGRADPGCFDPRKSVWYAHRSYAGPMEVQFGYRGVVPVNRDYDGDGRDDIGVFNPANATWHLALSRDGYRELTFGQRNAIPLGSPIRGGFPVRGLRRY